MARRRRGDRSQPVTADRAAIPGDGIAVAQPGEGAQPSEEAQPDAGGQPAWKQVRAPRTRAGTLWATLILGLVILIAILIFIFQNLQDARISFVTLHGRFPLGLALLFAAVLGALLAVCVGVVRMVQLRLLARRNLRAPGQPTSTRTK